jgi:hypothetical protein
MTDALDAALGYAARGWPVIAWPTGTKGSKQKGWPSLATTDEAIVRDRFNGNGKHNVGVLLGPELCDVDLDCREALAVAGYFLPDTGFMFGRASKRMSHRVYLSDAASVIGKAVRTFDDPEVPGPHMIELRVGGGGKAAQTIFPGSIHESGEPVECEVGFDKDPTQVSGAELICACEQAAAAALIARAYPTEGGHRPAQVVGGFLARAGWPASRVELFARAVLAHVGGQNAPDHVRTARNAAEAYERGRNACGFPQLAETFGEKRARRVAEWLHYSEATKAGTGRSKDKRADPEAGDDDPHESLIAELAALPPLKYARRRKAAADTIGIPVGMLDKLVMAERKAEHAGEAQPAHWDVEPWPDPVDGALLLDTVADLFSRYAVLPQHAPEALALWVVHAWALDCFQCSPLAALVSPTKRCGKTRVLAILKWLAPRSELAGSISAAALFRYIEHERPTLLIDEFDLGGDDEELRRILNSSHKRAGARVIRCEGEDNRPRPFSTWAPKAVATIAKLADTLRDRSIVIEMRRKTTAETVERWNDDDTEEMATLRRKILRWTEDQAEALKRAIPDVRADLDDRAADNWRPLLAIADVAGGNWPMHASDAAVGLSGDREDDEPLVRLLADIRDMFAEMPQATWIGSAQLAERLGKLDGSLWQEWKGGKPIAPAGIARLLKRCGIHPNRSAGTGGRYLKAAFEDAWTRYLPREA